MLNWNDQARGLVTGGEPTVVLDEDRAFVTGQGKVAEKLFSNFFDTNFQGLGERPMVALFGWAGAKHKHLDKYAEIYRWATWKSR